MILFSYALSILLMIALPIVLGVIVHRRFRTPWWLFCVGMAAFVGSQIVHLPLNDWLADAGILGRASSQDPGLGRTALLLGLSAGLCEGMARAVAYAWLSQRDRARRWEDAVMVGLGHGGIEAMTFGAVLMTATISSLLPLRGTDLAALGLPGDQVAALQQQMRMFASSPWMAGTPLLERVVALALHGSLSVLAWSAFKRHNVLYLVAAILCHALFDAAAVWMSQSVESVWVIEGVLVLLAVPLVACAWRLRPRVESRPWPRPRVARAFSTELWLFGWAVRKELTEQWRTKRVLVVGAVFLLFGLGSPLLARFTPELIGSIEGAEQFAGLIPTPTTADALSQYIKNLTQFGFILAVLLGMGAVAGEKEKGTAAMILSKPLPRWAFVLSKFVAQSLVYGMAFLLAALGAWYYTSILFDPLGFGPFMLGNLLLIVWLLTFAAITLLGSTMARSVGAAAGMGLGGSIVVLLLGGLPRVGPLTPAGLVAWAGQLGLGGDVSPNGGALVASLVLITLCVIGAIATLETQEL